jgi:hypothetical protein
LRGDDGILAENAQVAAGFFLALDFTVFGSATASGFRSIDVRRPDVKV